MRRVMIAGLTSGVGKTTICCALLAAYARRGSTVQPFKVGPDYIDPSHHTFVAGRPSRNLDSVLLTPDRLRASLISAAHGADICLIEGVMGLFDGRGSDGAGSSAAVAKLLSTPIVVVLDVSHTAHTAGAMALGCVALDPAIEVVGFILNRVASPSHAQIATEAVERATGLPVLGALPRDPQLTLPERYLGLIPTGEVVPAADLTDRLVAVAEAHLALDRIWAVAATGPLTSAALPASEEPPRRRVTVALARDRAFSFYYEDSLDVLRDAGADLVPFSPLTDAALPPGTEGVYLGGGFPELFAEELAANQPMHASLRAAAGNGRPIYGECGGLMYLGRSLADPAGHSWPMVGLVPCHSHMGAARVTVGYRTITALRPSPLMRSGTTSIGHEFHYSQPAEPVDPASAAYALAERGGSLEGYVQGSVLASYVHLHFGTEPGMAARFVEACARRTM